MQARVVVQDNEAVERLLKDDYVLYVMNVVEFEVVEENPENKIVEAKVIFVLVKESQCK